MIVKIIDHARIYKNGFIRRKQVPSNKVNTMKNVIILKRSIFIIYLFYRIIISKKILVIKSYFRLSKRRIFKFECRFIINNWK